jgi:hypothetical protein
MATKRSTRFALPRVDLKVLVPTLALIGAEVWYLTTRADAWLVPVLWMAPMDAFLLLYAFDESVALLEVALVLFAGRLLYLPYLFLTPTDSLLLFYGLFMAPADVLIAVYAIHQAGRTVVDTARAA